LVVSLVVMLAYGKVAMMAAHLVVQMVCRTAAWTAYYLAAVRVEGLAMSLVVLLAYQKVAMMAAHWVVQMVY